MDSRWEKVVLPEEEGPAIMTKRTSFREAISAAMSPIFFSIMASWARMRGVAPPWEMVVFSSATLEAFSASERSVDP